MKACVFDAHSFEVEVFKRAASRLPTPHQLVFFEFRLTEQTAASASGFEAVIVFVNDRVGKETITALSQAGVRLIATRSAGYNHVDLEAARELGIPVVRVPEYSPHAVAEHAVALLLTLNRKTHKAYNRVREQNFSLEGLTGFDLAGKTVGVVGLGKIGRVFAHIMNGFGCRVLGFDPAVDRSTVPSVEFVDFTELLRQSDIISLHCPLNEKTRHLFDQRAFGQVKPSLILVNTGRGALIDSVALIEALKAKRIGGAALDVYEEEEGIFFEDLSRTVLQDDKLARLLTFPNVLVTAHQAFLTNEALEEIAGRTLDSLTEFERGERLTASIP